MEHRSGSDHAHAHALLGYRPRDPFGTPATAAPERTSDVNFRDVFGGPPRRHSAVYESRRSRTDSLDSRSLRERASDGGGRILEKPVFGGECGSPARRRHLGDDFFSDIFPGSDSSCSSPVRLDRDAYPSSPGSRVLSPSRPLPLPPRCEPFVGGSSLPAQLSLSTKLAKGIDQPTFNPPTHPAQYKKDVGSPNAFGVPSSPNASTTQALPVSEDLRNDAYTCYRQSPLSRQVSHDLDKSLEAMDSGSLNMQVPSKKNPTSLEGYIRRHQFHFSIYKWAGKGVTLIMPSNTKDKNDSRFRRLPEVVLQGVGVPSDDDNIPITIIASKNKSENKDSKSLKDLIMNINNDAVSTSVEELLPAGFDSKSLCSDVAEESDTFSDNSKKNPVAMHEGLQPKMKNLRQLLEDDVKKHGNEDTVRQVNKTDNFYGVQQNVYDDASAKQHAGKENSLHHVEVVSPSMKDVQVSLDDKMLGGRVKGKVKDFIKIFNQEASPKHKGIVETQYRKSRGKDRVKSKVEGQVGTTAPKAVEEVKASSRASEINMVKETKADSIISNESLRDTPITMNQNLKAEKPDSTMRSDVNMINDSSSKRKEDSGPCFEPTPETIDDLECNIEESHCEDLEGCLVEQLTREQNDHLQTDTHQDQIKASEAKISEWSKGKEGNIRSMLSTLQYVLWPESGWKPVPLVDIIEGASVKRAYQKALLCLHPDKLQQKGAAIHQKYIAGKVFDILQEAWEHFNSVSSF